MLTDILTLTYFCIFDFLCFLTTSLLLLYFQETSSSFQLLGIALQILDIMSSSRCLDFSAPVPVVRVDLAPLSGPGPCYSFLPSSSGCVRVPPHHSDHYEQSWVSVGQSTVSGMPGIRANIHCIKLMIVILSPCRHIYHHSHTRHYHQVAGTVCSQSGTLRRTPSSASIMGSCAREARPLTTLAQEGDLTHGDMGQCI